MKNLVKTAINKLKLLAASFAVAASMGVMVSPAVLALDCSAAGTPNAPACKVQDGVQGSGGTGAGNTADSFTNLIKAVIDILLFVIGAVAVIMIIIGGIRYTTSNGDQGQVTSAKNTILYAIVGLVVAIMAYAIVNFVISKL